MPNAEPRQTPDPESPVGVFDSGLGGLSILRELARELPDERFVYFGDTAHIPYGPRSLEEVRTFCTAIARNLIGIPAKAVVVACNAASAASLAHLRTVFPATPFIGMEPAIKPAAATSKTGKVGVLATRATFQGQLFESAVERFARGTEVLCQACPGLADFIEKNPPGHPGLVPLLDEFIGPLRERGIDTLVLACTHYPLVKAAIAEVAGPGIAVIDPSPAIAKRTRQVLAGHGLLRRRSGGGARYCVSGDAARFAEAARAALGVPIEVEKRAYSTE